MSKVLLCITGSISAYKGPSIANGLKKDGHEVKVVLTNSALKFITKLSFSSQGFETYTDIDEWENDKVLHIELSKWADNILIAPLSANTLAKIANGLSDNLLTSIMRAFPYQNNELDEQFKKLIIAPAMNTKMYESPITLKHINIINEYFNNGELNKNDKFKVVYPIVKLLACKDNGIGALAPTKEIVESIS